MHFWENKSVLLSGGNGFLGKYVYEELKNNGCKKIFIPAAAEFDLTNLSCIKKVYDLAKPNIIIHLAAAVGGIGANESYPGTFFYRNLIMGIQMMEEARLRKIEKFVNLGTICCYPKVTEVPFKEEDLWQGYPDETTGYYGLAKKMLLVQSTAYRKEFNFNSIFLMPTNLYGPHDNFIGNNSHVVPALIKRFMDAKLNNQSQVTCWGTGTASREFLHVRDCAKGILLATEKLNQSTPINLGTGIETKIRDLVELIAEYTEYKGEIIWDSSKPDGQPRRCLDIKKAKEYFDFEATISLPEGLAETIEWYKKTFIL